jgi:hypothetical protein
VTAAAVASKTSPMHKATAAPPGAHSAGKAWGSQLSGPATSASCRAVSTPSARRVRVFVEDRGGRR